MSALAHVDKIMIVEDDFFLATDLKETLRELGCGEIRIARTVSEALATMDTGIRFATVDVKVDGEPCLAVVEALISRRIPFIYVSGYPEADHIDLPAAPWVSKPVEMRALQFALQAISLDA